MSPLDRINGEMQLRLARNGVSALDIHFITDVRELAHQMLDALRAAERVVRSVDRSGLKSCGQELQQIHDAIDRANGDAPGTYEEKEYG